jgi:hypothetical protein
VFPALVPPDATLAEAYPELPGAVGVGEDVFPALVPEPDPMVAEAGPEPVDAVGVGEEVLPESIPGRAKVVLEVWVPAGVELGEPIGVVDAKSSPDKALGDRAP